MGNAGFCPSIVCSADRLSPASSVAPWPEACKRDAPKGLGLAGRVKTLSPKRFRAWLCARRSPKTVFEGS